MGRQASQHIRLQDLIKERNDRLKVMQKEIAKKGDKSREDRRKHDRERERHNREIEKNSLEKQTKLQERIVDIEAGYKDFRDRNSVKREEIQDRVEKHEAALVKGREDAWADASSRHQQRMDAFSELLGQRESHAEEMQTKLNA